MSSGGLHLRTKYAPYNPERNALHLTYYKTEKALTQNLLLSVQKMKAVTEEHLS